MGNYWNPAKVASAFFELQNNNVRVHSIATGTNQAAIGEVPISGKKYFEIHPVTLNNYEASGICNSAHLPTERLGFNDNSWSWLANGGLYHSSSYTTSVGFTASDILQCAVDLDTNQVWFGKNDVWLGDNPTTGTGAQFTDAGITGDIFAGFGHRYANNDVDLAVFELEFVYSPPTGFSALVALPESTTGTADGVTATTATLNGTLDSLGGEASVDVYFEWGLTTGYGNTTALQALSAPGAFSENISGLAEVQTYYFRAVVTDGVDVWYGADASFTTPLIERTVAGTVLDATANPLQRTVRIYDRATGDKVDETVSAADGSFSFSDLLGVPHYIVALDDTADATDFNALIFDLVYPVEV